MGINNIEVPTNVVDVREKFSPLLCEEYLMCCMENYMTRDKRERSSLWKQCGLHHQ